MDDLGWRPAKRPDRTPLTGDSVLLEPLEVARHGEELYASTAGADSTWDYLPYGPFAGKGDFMAWLEQRAPVAGRPGGVRGLACPCELRSGGRSAPVAGRDPRGNRSLTRPIGH